MAYPLLSNPRKHYYTTRTSPILGIVLHVTAGLEDFTPPDSGAEATIKYGQSNTRPASWHGIVDSDSVIDCLPDTYTAFHVVGFNSPTLGLEIANRDAKWTGKPQRWVDDTIRNAAEWCRPRVEKYGLPVQLCTAAEVRSAVAARRKFGFTYHRYLDPKRRIDPGFDFPWTQFAGYLRGGTSAGVSAARPEPPLRVRGPFPLPSGHWYGVNDRTSKSHSGLRDRDEIGVQQIQATVGADVDGSFGPATEAKVKAWQQAKGLPVTGRVDAATWQAMLRGTDAAPAPAPAPKAPAWPLPSTHRIGPNPRGYTTWHDGTGKDTAGRAAIKTWQQRMIDRGWHLGKAGADGLWGSDTARVVAAFQKEKKITETGLGPVTWAAAWTAPVTS